jgi:5-amino-6-(5-phospho-D-ribitylamino)uracil phosphatase
MKNSWRRTIDGVTCASSAPIRMVAIDLDGTLLNDSKQVAGQTAEALRCLPGRGVKVVIASARPPRSVRPFHQLLGLDTLQINYNGALIWEPSTGRPFYHQPMAAKLVGQMVEVARDLFDEVLVSCEILDRWYTDRFEQAFTTETGRLFRPDLVAPLEQFLVEPVTKLMLLGEGRLIVRVEDALIAGGFARAVGILRCEPELLQIMDNRASKAAALRMVAGHYGIPMEQVMAIGDAANDVPMLEAAGIAVAVDNAHPLVKEAADWVAPSNNDHGVHAALRRYGLCE